MKRCVLTGLAALVVVLAGVVMVEAQIEDDAATAAEQEQATEQEEHPEAGEAPDAPAAEEAQPHELDAAMVKIAVANYIAADMKIKGGYFLYYDAVLNRTWRLKDPKPAEIVRSQGPDASVLCVKMASGTGKDRKTLDVDFFAGRNEAGDLAMRDIKIHKVSGKARFTYDASNQIQAPTKKANRKKTTGKAAKTG